MVHEHYEIQRRGNPDTASAVRSIIRNHLVPVFGGPITYDAEAGAARVIEWTVACAGRQLAQGDLPERHRLDLGAVRVAKPPVAQKTMSERLKVLQRILRFASTRDPRVAKFADGVSAQEPSGWQETRPKMLTFTETALLAAEMHVVSQFTLCLIRVLGPRISEPYGILVGDVFDPGDRMALLLQAQGGRKFALWGDELGEVIETTHKKGGKTTAAYRLVGIPYQLAELIRIIIAAYHTDPDTGEVDLTARLIPGIRAEDSGQGGFRSALARAAERSCLEIADDERLFAHGQRKALCSDFGRNPEIDDFLARRWAGHRAGDDVHGTIYVLDQFHYETLLPAVKALEAQIEAEVGPSLIVATTLRPQYGKDFGPKDLARVDAVLAQAAWQLSRVDEGRVSTEEAARALAMSPSATRRLFPNQIPAVKMDGSWYPKLDDVLAYRDRLAGWVLLPDLAEQVNRTYHQVRTMAIDHLGLAPRKDDYSRQFLLSDQEAELVREEFGRADRLYARAVPVSAACRLLGASLSAVGAMARRGDLDYDPDRDRSGERFVTRASVAAEVERREKSRSPVVAKEDLMRVSGLDDAGLKALERAGLLTVVRRRGYTVGSVRRWATGWRPDLLLTDLFQSGVAVEG
jgi:hypothetical protein